MENPTDPGVLAWLADKAWMALTGLMAIVWRQNESAHKETRAAAAEALAAHQAQDDKEFKALHEEQTMQRGHIAKIFDQMRDESRRSEERHVELIQRTHDGQRELLVALNAKADK